MSVRRLRRSTALAPLLTLAIAFVPGALVPAAAAAQSGGTAPADPAASPPAEDEPVIRLKRITVTATRTPRPAIEVPAAITVIDEEEILRRQAQSLDDLLRDVPGLEMAGGPRTTAEQPSIRGLGDERILIRLDGARQNFQAGHKGRTFLDPSLLKQVDVLRGPASALYGSGALGGVIALTTKDPADLLKDGDKAGGRARLSWQDNGDEFVASLTGYGAPSDTVGLLASATYRNSGDVDSGSDLSIPYTGDDLVSGLVKMDWAVQPDHRLRLSWQGYRNDQDLPSAPDTDDLSILVDRITRQDTATLAYEGQSGPWFDMRGTVYWTRTKLDEDRIGQPRADDTELETIGVDLANTSRFTAGPAAVALTYGIEAYRDEQRGTRDGGPRPQFPDADSEVLGLFAQAETVFAERFTLTPAIRYDRFDQSADGQEGRTDSEVSPSLRAAFDATPWMTLYASYATAFRSPSLTELYNSGLHFPGVCPIPGRPCIIPNNFFVPNPDLEPESGATVEIGGNLDFDDVFLARDRLLLKAALFRNDVDDFIEQAVLISQGQTTRRNVQDAIIKGMEVELTYDSPTWFGSVSGSLLRGEDDDTGLSLDSIPADRLVLTAGRTLPEYDLSAGWRTTLADEQDRVASAEPTAGYVIHDLFVVWQPREALRLDLGIDNIFDKAYRRHLSSIPERGRTFKVAAGVSF
ncbi:TonB-dependent hemoglobin/transferrin/lactoferrin family receptor [Rhodospirillum centenum]|uniref:TonB-dependent hemoglobin n=1 Tax=Rhodospirillum centenum (strain ATCC 51521 / SW) TaxID=414684 RepID=B6IY25_RHOCS|nr:TonB-dependent hemoglobin/transferrin/lactoferrin family receptor [Rhodospirillum centenum]ACJ01199.1 TonB-dependent hemoglobin [Rhodospirillum centenum SW]